MKFYWSGIVYTSAASDATDKDHVGAQNNVSKILALSVLLLWGRRSDDGKQGM